MRRSIISKVVLGTLFLAPASFSPAAADTLSFGSALINSSANNAAESLTFVATDTTETIAIGGYQIPGWELVTNAAVKLNGSGANLLYPGWTAATSNSGFAGAFADGSAVQGLRFGGVTAGVYDTFSQVFTTVVGDSYTLSFLYSNDTGSSGLLVTDHPDGPLPGGGSGSGGATGVPEPATWAMTLLGFAALGFAARNRKRARTALASA